MTTRRPVRFSAHELAQMLDLFPPTEEQARIIESDLEPLVVIAGAGSGKTTVLAQRVVWLVANGWVPADRILGLTFTRKAVGELADRIRRLLARFRSVRPDVAQALALHWAEEELRRDAEDPAPGAGSGDTPGGPSAATALTGLDVPTVSTYNSYAASLVRDHGMAVGVEPDARVLDAAIARELAGTVVDAAAPHEVPTEGARTTFVDDVLALAGQVNEHLTDPQAVVDHVDASLDALLRGDMYSSYLAAIGKKRNPSKAEYPGDTWKEVRAAALARAEELAAAAGLGVSGLRATDPASREALLDHLLKHLPPTKWKQVRQVFGQLRRKRRIAVLADRYLAAKREAGALEFSDQVAYAVAALRADPQARVAERSRWDVVLLDEYQDTSSSQTVLLADLFGGMPVMAVGDPRQAIYAWRGASADNIESFPQAFRRSDGEVAGRAGLRTSWRNDEDILKAANSVSAGLPGEDPADALVLRPGGGPGTVVFRPTPGESDPGYGSDQYADLVSWLQEARGAGARSFAVLSRRRAAFGTLAAAVRAGGFEVAVVGASGALDDPYVADVHAALHVVADPGAGDHLMRLLSGRAVRLGAADLRRLNTFTRLRAARVDTPDAADRPGTVEAIDALTGARNARAGDGEDTAGVEADRRRAGLTEEVTGRLVRLGLALRRLRTGITTVPRLVRDVLRELDVDAEVGALTGIELTVHRRAVDDFLSLVNAHVAAHPETDLRGFLDWLAVMEAEDALKRPEQEAPEGVVTLMTVHASKGLEFDAVALPDMTRGDFPTGNREIRGWLPGGSLPSALRGDRRTLPRLDLTRERLTAGSDLDDLLAARREEFDTAHLMSERRLMYVAMTRARSFLWLGASTWSGRKSANEVSEFWTEAAAALGRREVGLPEVEDPRAAEEPTGVDWPVPQDPDLQAARARRLDVLAARSDRRVTLESLARDSRVPAVQVSAQRALDHLEEIRAARARALAWPDRVSTTGLVDLHRDPRAFARSRRRPMPAGPTPAAALGTEFHAWIENRYGQSTLGDPDLWAGVDGAGATGRLPEEMRERLATLQERFLASRWADRTPMAVERSFELVLTRPGGRTLHVPGKIDAVFATEDGLEVVDWKSGRKPSDADLADMTVQLSVYALALRGMPEFAGAGDITGVFCFFGSDEEVRVEQLHDEAGLVAALTAAD
ncbi:ATP-dependent helicase [Brevibacterium litoralis]|uniref:ATP-dependent helicase n=1 Tax=Brevibacterium litoralis TaxID=3138935 RepID=UPI0032EF29D6